MAANGRVPGSPVEDVRGVDQSAKEEEAWPTSEGDRLRTCVPWIGLRSLVSACDKRSVRADAVCSMQTPFGTSFIS